MVTIHTTAIEYLSTYQDQLSGEHFQWIRETIGTMAMEGMNLEDHDIDALVRLVQGHESLSVSLHSVTSSLVNAA